MVEAFRTSLKSVTRRPILALAIVVPLAMATAVSTALFSIADGLFWRPLPLKNAERTIAITPPPAGPRRIKLNEIFRDSAIAGRFRGPLRESPLLTTTISSFTGLDSPIAIETGLKVSVVDILFFDNFGLSPALGRLFTGDDQALADSRTRDNGVVLPAIVSDAYWRRELGGDAAVIGQLVSVAGQPALIVGVMPPGVKFPGRTDVWKPMNRAALNMHPAFAQLAPGATLEQLRSAFPLFDFAPLRESMRPPGAGTLAFIFANALALMLLAWVQVGGLVLTTATDRLREIAVRISLGAGHGRIVGQFAAESCWMVAAAFCLSWLATPLLARVLIDFLPDSLTATQYLQPDGRSFVFAVVISCVGFLLLTLTPFGLTRRVAPVSLMRGAMTESASPSGVRQGILITQIACTALLLYVAALSAFSYLSVLRYDYGFDAENVVFIEPTLNTTGATTGAQWASRFNTHRTRMATMAERLKSVPGVLVATPVTESPLKGRFHDFRRDLFEVDGRVIDSVPMKSLAAGPDIVNALGATLVAGTGLDRIEHIGRKDVALINQTLARQISPIATALGRRIRGEFIDATVVGVLKDLVDSAPETPAAPLVIQPSELRSHVAHQLLVRTSRPASAMIPTLRKVVEEEFGSMRSTQVRLLADDVDETVAPWRGRASVVSLVALLGLPLAIAGIASALFFLVRTRTRELGIRLALGATPEQARVFVLAYAIRSVIFGSGVGIVAGMLAGRAMAGVLFGVGSVSVVTVLAVAVMVVAITWTAAYVPARRASRIDPSIVLRAE